MDDTQVARADAQRAQADSVANQDAEPSQEETELIRRLPPDGSAIPNQRLMASLGWPDDHYWLVRNQLVERGIIERGRGRGGTVRLATDDDIVESPVATPPAGTVKRHRRYGNEHSLYGPMRDVIATGWAKEQGIEPKAVALTAQQGRRNTGGRYTRPDILVVNIRTYPYLPGKRLDVITFEIKPRNAIDVTCVYEALAHRQAATHAYVLLHIPEADTKKIHLDPVIQAAAAHGIGLIVAVDPADYATWETHLDAVRHEPDPDLLNQCIQRQLPPKDRDRIALACR